LNLHGIVGPYIGAVSPALVGMLKVSTGNTIGADFVQVPTYRVYKNVSMDVQALTADDLKQIDSLNQQGILRAVYLNGNVEGLDRPAGKGGDILIFKNQTWLVFHVLETWDSAGWCKVAVVLQE
jgi:hypothetical protein